MSNNLLELMAAGYKAMGPINLEESELALEDFNKFEELLKSG